MRVYRAKDYKDMSRKAANIISAQIILKPNSVLGLATGSTPIGTYSQLVDWYKKGDLDFSEVTSVNLDEYKGLPGTNDQSYYYFMHQHLFDQVNIQERHTHLPNGMEPDSKKECERYEELIRSLGGVDLQLRELEKQKTELENIEIVELVRGVEASPDRKSTRLNSSHSQQSRMPSSA